MIACRSPTLGSATCNRTPAALPTAASSRPSISSRVPDASRSTASRRAACALLSMGGYFAPARSWKSAFASSSEHERGALRGRRYRVIGAVRRRAGRVARRPIGQHLLEIFLAVIVSGLIVTIASGLDRWDWWQDQNRPAHLCRFLGGEPHFVQICRGRRLFGFPDWHPWDSDRLQ